MFVAEAPSVALPESCAICGAVNWVSMQIPRDLHRHRQSSELRHWELPLQTSLKYRLILFFSEQFLMSGLQYKTDITDEQYGGIWMFFLVCLFGQRKLLSIDNHYMDKYCCTDPL